MLDPPRVRVHEYKPEVPTAGLVQVTVELPVRFADVAVPFVLLEIVLPPVNAPKFEQ